MDRDVEIVADFWSRLDAGRLEAALSLVGEHGVWRPIAGGAEYDGREGMRGYLGDLRAAGGDMSGHACAIERRGEHVVVRGVIRYSSRGRLMESQGHWVHRVRDGAVVECRGVATAIDADAVVAA